MSHPKPSQAALDNRRNQLDPAHSTYHLSRGASSTEAANLAAQAQAALDNHANQLNPRHPEYYRSRGASSEEAASLAKGAE